MPRMARYLLPGLLAIGMGAVVPPAPAPAASVSVPKTRSPLSCGPLVMMDHLAEQLPE
jgi:hypothetical protein